ncbi:hypothetical protein E3N88_24235 [Mikania micrantha]|uniref:Uncharacterized protein n=1 Tax=Mikania micrantha TaxID=192012 RepID=A0A5N6NFQ4_9ASTR|nr:hypothetical protein E3N88_24235 [Mikania micrantha]
MAASPSSEPLELRFGRQIQGSSTVDGSPRQGSCTWVRDSVKGSVLQWLELEGSWVYVSMHGLGQRFVPPMGSAENVAGWVLG